MNKVKLTCIAIMLSFSSITNTCVAGEQTRDHWKDPINIIVATYNQGKTSFIYPDKATFEIPDWFFQRLNNNGEYGVRVPTKHYILPHDCLQFLMELDRINYYEEHVSCKFEISEIQYLSKVCASH